MNKQIKTCMVLDSLNVAAFSPDGKQIPELQMNLLEMWSERAVAAGYSVEGLLVETPLGTFSIEGRAVSWRPTGWNLPLL